MIITNEGRNTLYALYDLEVGECIYTMDSFVTTSHSKTPEREALIPEDMVDVVLNALITSDVVEEKKAKTILSFIRVFGREKLVLFPAYEVRFVAMPHGGENQSVWYEFRLDFTRGIKT